MLETPKALSANNLTNINLVVTKIIINIISLLLPFVGSITKKIGNYQLKKHVKKYRVVC